MKKTTLGLILLLVCATAVGDVSAQTYSYTPEFDPLDAEWDLWNVSHTAGYLFNDSGDAAYARVELLHDGGLLEMEMDIRRISADWYMYSSLSVDNGIGGYDNYCTKEWGWDVVIGEPYTTWYHSCNDVPAGPVWLYVYFLEDQETFHLGSLSISSPLANPISTPTPTGIPSTETPTPTPTMSIGVTPVTPSPTPTMSIGVTPVTPEPSPTPTGMIPPGITAEPPTPGPTVTPFADTRMITQTLPGGPLEPGGSIDFPPLPPPVDYEAFGTLDWEWEIAFTLEHFALIISAARTLPLMITSLPYYPYVVFFLLVITAYKVIGRIIFTDNAGSGEVPNQPRNSNKGG